MRPDHADNTSRSNSSDGWGDTPFYAHYRRMEGSDRRRDTEDGYCYKGSLSEFTDRVRTPARLLTYEQRVNLHIDDADDRTLFLAWGASIEFPGGREHIPVLVGRGGSVRILPASQRFRGAGPWYQDGYNDLLYVDSHGCNLVYGEGDGQVSQEWLHRVEEGLKRIRN